ncbi:hypothetical protein I4U23_011785 [Adineta vaga]|nr:hypothetical protein I4U23_011785 [Adineta vaga]
MTASNLNTSRQKLALVIGNNDYNRTESKLRHCINDANDLSDKLIGMGFIVDTKINLTNKQMVKAITNFSGRINNGDLVLFYFSGHGYEVKGSNYLMPIDDEDVYTEDDVEDSAVPVERTLKRLAMRNPSHVTIFILDCCRNYWPGKMPKTKGGTDGKGLGFVDAPAGTFIQFACGAHRTASDGEETDRNGLFTKHLLKHIASPKEDIVQIFQGIAGDVYTESKGKQRPLSINGFIKKGHVYLNEYIDTKSVLVNSNNEKISSVITTIPSQKSRELLNSSSLSSSLDSLPNSHANDNSFMILIGRLTKREHLDELKNIIEGNTQDMIKLENLLEYLTITEDREDRFNTTLFDLIGRDRSFETLKQICRHYESERSVNVDEIMKKHEELVQKSAPYFTRKDFPADSNQAAALVLSFYTGGNFDMINRGARLIARHSANERIEKNVQNEIIPMVFYFFKALLHIPYCWEMVTCTYELTGDELELYEPGNLVKWIQFGQGNIDDEVTSDKKNTQFKIDSFSARSIKQFSQNPDKKEVIFLPQSTFFVYKHHLSRDQKQHTIYMRQVELGLSIYSILWVDDKIFGKNSEIKNYMENAVRDGMNLDVHFIPRTSTDDALAFLRSPFGQRLKNETTFRLITCMYRKNEYPVHNAGVRLIKSIRQLGFSNYCLVFTSDKKRAETIVQSELSSTEQQLVFVATKVDELRDFIKFMTINKEFSA